jgi:hypothetical protein
MVRFRTVRNFGQAGLVWRIALLLGLGVLAGCQHAPPQAQAPALLKIGAAEMDITPPAGYRMAGYFDERLATGVHDPLKAKAIVLEQGRQEIALVFCDLIGLSLHVTTNARALASRRTGIPAANIVMSATHSHTGPLFDDIRRDYFHQAALAKFGTDPHEAIDYPAFLIDRLAEVVAAAQANARPARLAAGVAEQNGMTFNRRYWMKDGKVRFNPGQLNTNIVRPAGPSDPDVGILLAGDLATGQPFAGVTVFAMHSDTVGGTQYSADYEFYLEQTLRQRFGSDFISAFGAGACGDLNHIDVTKKEPVSGFNVAERIGRALGQTVLRADADLPALKKPALAARAKTLRVPLQKVSPEQLARAESMIDKIGDPKTDFYARVEATKVLDLAQRGPSLPMEVQVFRLDAKTAIVCLPAEILVELGLAIKRASPFTNTLVMTICNDRPSYVPTRKAFAEGSYEVTNSRVEPGTGERLVQTALALLKSLANETGGRSAATP